MEQVRLNRVFVGSPKVKPAGPPRRLSNNVRIRLLAGQLVKLLQAGAFNREHDRLRVFGSFTPLQIARFAVLPDPAAETIFVGVQFKMDSGEASRDRLEGWGGALMSQLQNHGDFWPTEVRFTSLETQAPETIKRLVREGRLDSKNSVFFAITLGGYPDA